MSKLGEQHLQMLLDQKSAAYTRAFARAQEERRLRHEAERKLAALLDGKHLIRIALEERIARHLQTLLEKEVRDQ